MRGRPGIIGPDGPDGPRGPNGPTGIKGVKGNFTLTTHDLPWFVMYVPICF